MVDTSVRFSDLLLDNPVVPASGTFGYGKEYAELYDINLLGSFSFKGTTLTPRFGNPTPRIADCTSGMINSVGLQNPGVEEVLHSVLPEMRGYFHKKVIANVCGFSIEEYVETARRLSEDESVGILEINISCPNVQHGGMSFGTDEKMAYEVTRAVKRAVKKPVMMKLTPNAPDICRIAKACEDGGADAVSLINTLLGMRIDLKSKRPVIHNIKGGFSGPAVFPIALRMVYDVYNTVRIPIMGMGGVSSAEDVIEMMLAGATAVQVGTANLKNPYACKEIIENLPKAMSFYGVDRLQNIIGEAH
ncbi:MAG: dihydroorotate dehydrogenase [Clostridia bacterium]|nr:dihydroorotate dehydrogenase [Clostridia bacterium]